MEIRSTISCCGCLNNGRRMVEISEINLRKCFSEIINENLISNFSSQLLQLCFECTAMLLKFTNFRLQVSACYKTFQTYAKQNSSFNRKPIMRLCTKQLHNIQINTSVTSQSREATEVIGNVKVENDTDDVLVDVLETDVIKDEFSNQDVLLIKNSSFNRRPITGHRSIRLPSLHVDELNTSQSSEVTEVIADNVKVETETDDVLDVDNVKEEFSDHDDEVPLIKIKKKKKRPNGKLEKDREVEFTEVTLSAKEIEHERATLALRDDYVNAMFRCDKCLLTFPNEDDLNDHVRVKHEQYASHYKCAICTCSFISEVSYNYHTNKHTRRYQCTVCADKFTSKRAAIKHYNFIHCYGAAIEYEFDQNNLDNTDQTAVKDAEEKDVSTAEENTFPCDFCEKNFKWKTSLRKHLEKHRIENGQKRKPYCAPCRLSFTTTPNLQKHVRTSSKHQIQLKLRKLNENSESNDKETPQKQSKQKTQLMDEIKSSVNKSQPKYLCHQCDKVFLWRGNLLRHLQSHAAKAKGDLVCKPCNRTFSSIATYQQHMKISKKHVSENDFKYMCSECGKRFATKSQLRDHINWEHLKNFVYTCDECQKVFKTSNSVYLHKQAVHKKDSVEHLCDHCGKPFPSKAKLRNHILGTHSGGALYRCACCDARFSWQSCLSRHVRHKHRKMTDKVS